MSTQKTARIAKFRALKSEIQDLRDATPNARDYASYDDCQAARAIHRLAMADLETQAASIPRG